VCISGTQGSSKDEMAPIIFETMVDFILQQKPNNLKLFRVVIYDDFLVERFISAMRKLAETKYQSSGIKFQFPSLPPLSISQVSFNLR
jgi:hypothetical protein